MEFDQDFWDVFLETLSAFFHDYERTHSNSTLWNESTANYHLKTLLEIHEVMTSSSTIDWQPEELLVATSIIDDMEFL